MMFRLACTLGLYLAMLAVIVHSNLADAQEKPHSIWQPGQYRGLVTGKSTAKDVSHVLGLPSWQGKPQEVPDVPVEEEWSYKLPTPQGECCDLFFKKGVLKSINLRLNGMPSDKAESLFGPGFEQVRFSTKDDRSETGSGLLCEDPKGGITMMLNSRMGLSLWLDGGGLVQEAVYSDTRPGHRHCAVKSNPISK